MKKLFFLLLMLTIILVTPAFAVETNIQNKADLETGKVSPTGNQIRNENQIRTENMGDSQQIQTQNQEQENLSTQSGIENKNATAEEHMSIVARSVQTLLQMNESGFGQQIRVVAREQEQAQNQIQSELGKVGSRSGALKFLIGPDYVALKSLQQQITQNQARIQQLTQLESQLTNQADKNSVSQAIQALTQLNTSLQDKVSAENNSVSLFGWLFKLFAK